MTQPEHTVIATFTDPAHARHAIRDLERSGFEPHELALDGRSLTAVDRMGMWKARIRRAIASGAALTALIALFAAEQGWMSTAAAFVTTIAIAFALAVWGVRQFGRTRAWRDTFFVAPDQPTSVALRSNRGIEVSRAMDRLGKHQPIQLTRS